MVVIRHLSLHTGVGLLLLALDHEALKLVAVRGMHEAALLVTGIMPEEVLQIAHIASILRGSPLSRWRFLMPTAMVSRVASSGALGLLGLLGVPLAGYVHPCLPRGVGPSTEAFCHSVVLPRNVHDAEVELGERLMPSGPPCRQPREGVDVLLVPAL